MHNMKVMPYFRISSCHDGDEIKYALVKLFLLIKLFYRGIELRYVRQLKALLAYQREILFNEINVNDKHNDR